MIRANSPKFHLQPVSYNFFDLLREQKISREFFRSTKASGGPKVQKSKSIQKHEMFNFTVVEGHCVFDNLNIESASKNLLFIFPYKINVFQESFRSGHLGYVVIEYRTGGSIEDRVKENVFDFDTGSFRLFIISLSFCLQQLQLICLAVTIVRGILKGLEFIHSKNIAHCDLKLGIIL